MHKTPENCLKCYTEKGKKFPKDTNEIDCLDSNWHVTIDKKLASQQAICDNKVTEEAIKF